MTGFSAPDPFRTRPELRGTFGMAASTHWIATATAQAVLERGGNAFDAAVAAAFVLHVVEPHLNGPGGDLVGIYATADDPAPRVMAGQGPAPAAATIEHYRAQGFAEMPGSGVLAAAIPGAVPAWLRLLETRGTWELAEVLAFAIGYARNGHPLLEAVVRTLATVRDLFEQHWPTSAAHWIPGGRMPLPGELVTNEPYARTLERLIEAGADAGPGRGATAATREDRIRAATATEALKLALADRDAWYGDGTVPPDLLAELLSPEYARERAALVGDTASLEFRPGRPGGREPWLPPLTISGAAGAPADGLAGSGEPTISRTGITRGDTCHLDVVDRHGNLVSVTPSGGWLQSSPTIPELGFCLGSRLQMTWLDAASPSALTPGRRPRTTLSPTLLLRGGIPVETLGTPGGDQQDQWQLLYLLRRLVGGYEPQQAIDAPTFHTASHVASFEPRQWAPGELTVEGRVGAEVLDELRRRGHRVTVAGDWTLGRLSMVGRDPATGLMRAAANPRGAQGYASGR
jgi:gamma-glutamyltranspeptidase/glutathione hydrolase